MSFKETLKKVHESTVYKEFSNKFPDAELCAGFFILDFVSNDNKNSIDFKTGEKIYTFEVLDSGKVKMVEDELIKGSNHPPLQKINGEDDVKMEVEELKGISGVRALDEGISSKFNKIIAVLQNLNDRLIWNLTCMLDGLIILNILVDAKTGEIIKFQRKSMMDMIRKK